MPGFNQPGNFKEQSASWVCEASPLSSQGKRLAGKPSAEQVEIGQSFGICCSDVLTEPLSFRGKQGLVTLVGTLVDFAMAHTGKASGAGKPFPEPACAGKQVDKLDSRYITPFLIFCGAAARMRGIPPFGENKKAPGGWKNPVPGADGRAYAVVSPETGHTGPTGAVSFLRGVGFPLEGEKCLFGRTGGPLSFYHLGKNGPPNPPIVPV